MTQGGQQPNQTGQQPNQGANPNQNQPGQPNQGVNPNQNQPGIQINPIPQVINAPPQQQPQIVMKALSKWAMRGLNLSDAGFSKLHAKESKTK